MPGRVALIVDNPYRDLPGLALVASRLCQEGVICYLVPFNRQGSELWSLAPDFVLLNYLRTVNQDFAGHLAEAGIKVGVLDTEGGALASLDSYGQSLAQDPRVRAKVACYCSWGPRLAEHAVHSGWFTPEQVAVTGAPRYDFYAASWRRTALEVSADAAPYDKDLVLVNGNFTLVNPLFKSPEAEARMLAEHFGYGLDHVLEWQRIQKMTMRELVTLTNRLARRFPEATFVYRPHPFERVETYEDLLEKRDNLHLLRVGTADGWILRSKAVIQRSCSTAIDAGVAGVPSLLPVWIPTPENLPAAEEVSVQCQTEEEMSGTLDSILSGRFQQPAGAQRRLDEVVRDWFYRIDGEAHQRVAERILQSLPANGSRDRLRNCRDWAYGLAVPRQRLKWKARAMAQRSLGLSVHWSFRRRRAVPDDLSWWDCSEKRFDARQVGALVDAIQACTGNGSSPQRRVRAVSSQERGDYHFGYLQGRSVTVFPE